MQEILEEHKKIILICICLFIFAILLFFLQKMTSNKEGHKMIKGNAYVYTADTYTSKGGKTSYQPVINLDFAGVSEYNSHIKEAYEASIEIEENTVTYQYTITKNILFLLIKFSYYDEETQEMETTYRSFNIDLKKGKLLQNDDVLKRYGYTKDDISKTVENTFKKYYTKGVDTGYIDGKMCDFSCFLYNHLVDENDFTSGVSLYFENDSLVIYKPFLLNSVLTDKTIFPLDAFQMKIEGES